MGSPSSETGRGSDETQHQVTLTNGFYLGKYELTQAQYETVMNGNPDGLNAKPSNWPNNPNRPVEKVSWDDAQIFLTRLNAAEQAAGRLPAGWSYVLPTESEWEYAAALKQPKAASAATRRSGRPAVSVFMMGCGHTDSVFGICFFQNESFFGPPKNPKNISK